MIDTSERRQYNRISFQSPMTPSGQIALHSGRQKECPCMIWGLSLGGTCLSVAPHILIEKGDVLSLNLMRTESEIITQGRILLEVCWLSPEPEKKVVGCRFLTLNRASHENIAYLIHTHQGEGRKVA